MQEVKQERKQVSADSKVVFMLLFVFVLALVINLCVGFTLGMQREMESDALYFRQIAQSISDGCGYYHREGFWPDEPTMSRLPAWPFAISLLFRTFPGICPDMSMRFLNIVLNAVVAVLVAWLTRMLFRNMTASLVAGILYSVHPSALFLTYTGESEILFLLLTLSGVIMMLSSAGIRWAGFILLGVSCLVRANFILWIIFYTVLCLVMVVKSHLHDITGSLGERRWANDCSICDARFPLLTFTACVLLFALSPTLWMLRNYSVCGHFPVMSSLKGEVLYGGNNVLTCEEFEYWGYWVFPDRIPGEVSKANLALRMNEYEMDAYYSGKGKAFVRKNLVHMPRLLIGKFVRAYIPLPWKLKPGTVAVSLYRWSLYLAAIVGIVFAWKRMSHGYVMILFALILVNVFTVLVFWGCARFAFELEPFLLPLAAMGLLRLVFPRVFSGATIFE
ncbi:MAG: hypothetical protein A2283_17110 [Lentisphaerae bacterium RIFOXYA12_FULL_48_11]|nr:MAG: hypothetical protein A2283_17110 [Lentisphaerae bacterium RIFOXYA12_FULL_48_11]